jgi:hypothetical protein
VKRLWNVELPFLLRLTLNCKCEKAFFATFPFLLNSYWATTCGTRTTVKDRHIHLISMRSEVRKKFLVDNRQSMSPPSGSLIYITLYFAHDFLHRILSFIGLALCLSIMLMTSVLFAAIAMGMAIVMYKYIEYCGWVYFMSFILTRSFQSWRH